MANEVFNRLGVRNLTGADDRELFLEEFTGEVLGKFKVLCKFQDHTYTRTITEGKAARFDAMGSASAFYYSIGDNLAAKAGKIALDSFLITLDTFAVSSDLIPELDELLNHYDVRAKHSDRMAEALSLIFDRNVAVCGVRAARHAAHVPGGDGGTRIVNAAYGTDINQFIKGVANAAKAMDSKNISKQKRTLFVRPEQYYNLIEDSRIINREIDGAGSISKGVIHELFGFRIVETTTLPNYDVTDSPYPKYNCDCTGTVALCMTDEAVGTVKRIGLTTELTREHALLSHLLSTRMLVGHDVLRPECAVEIAVA